MLKSVPAYWRGHYFARAPSPRWSLHLVRSTSDKPGWRPAQRGRRAWFSHVNLDFVRRRRGCDIAVIAYAAAFSLLFGIMLGYVIMLVVWGIVSWR